MLVEQTVTSLEMTSPEELRPGREPPAPVELEAGDRSLVPLLRATCDRVGAPHGWTSRPAWSQARWVEHLAEPEVRVWLARVGGEPAGLIELVAEPEDEVELTIFGLVPELVGRGFGGHLLTLCGEAGLGDPPSRGRGHPAGVAAHRLDRPRQRPRELPGPGVPRGPHRGPAQAGPGGGGA
jgi:hypothetical protein